MSVFILLRRRKWEQPIKFNLIFHHVFHGSWLCWQDFHDKIFCFCKIWYVCLLADVVLYRRLSKIATCWLTAVERLMLFTVVKAIKLFMHEETTSLILFQQNFVHRLLKLILLLCKIFDEHKNRNEKNCWYLQTMLNTIYFLMKRLQILFSFKTSYCKAVEEKFPLLNNRNFPSSLFWNFESIKGRISRPIIKTLKSRTGLFQVVFINEQHKKAEPILILTKVEWQGVVKRKELKAIS